MDNNNSRRLSFRWFFDWQQKESVKNIIPKSSYDFPAQQLYGWPTVA